MQSQYLYAGTYSSMLINRLLTNNQRDLLLATTSLNEVRKVLQDTCFAPYLSSDRPIPDALDDFILAQKELLYKIAPSEKTLALLFLHYDYANLKLIHKALAAGENAETILSQCWKLGIITPEIMLKALAADKARELGEEFAWALKQKELHTQRAFSEIVDIAYLRHLRASAKGLRDKFINSYVATTIDFYNLQLRLRSFVHTESESIIVHGELADGGTLTADDLGSLEIILKRLPDFGGQKLWREAIAKFTETHDFTPIDRAFDNYLAEFLKQATIDPHTPATLFAYFLSATEHAQFVRTVIAARNVGLAETDLRALVRNSIHDYAY